MVSGPLKTFQTFVFSWAIAAGGKARGRKSRTRNAKREKENDKSAMRQGNFPDFLHFPFLM
jgi:hypothetical protein